MMNNDVCSHSGTGYQPVSSFRKTRAGSPCRLAAVAALWFAGFAFGQTAPSTQPAGPGFPTSYVDPVPHEIITQPYRVCQDLEELTSRINNLYRKPYAKLFDANGSPQPEVVYFKDVTSGHEVMSLGQLKVLQEVITLTVFVPFAVFYMREKLTLDYLWAALCLLVVMRSYRRIAAGHSEWPVGHGVEVGGADRPIRSAFAAPHGRKGERA